VASATAGRRAEAGEAWERALALDPGHASVRRNLERLHGESP
jgi:Flp pilus assembly protein TadD